MMVSAWELPTTLSVGGRDYPIRTDFRAVLDVLRAYADPDLGELEKMAVMLRIIYKDKLPPAEFAQDAVDAVLWFIDCGQGDGDTDGPRVMDWEQDGAMICSAVNKVAGREVRAETYLHWWTFYGYFMEIEGGLFSQVLGVRQKLAAGKRLESWEREFLANNRALCELDGGVGQGADDEEYFEKLMG